MFICDWIWENVHSSHIQFFNFGDSQNFIGMINECQTFRNCRNNTILVSLMKVSNQYAILCCSYGSLNVQNGICKLGTFSQIQSCMSSNLFNKPYIADYKNPWHANCTNSSLSYYYYYYYSWYSKHPNYNEYM